MTNALAGLASPKLYIFTYDALHSGANANAIHQYIVDSKNFVSWSHYVPGVYVFKSVYSAQYLATIMKNVVGEAAFFIAEINAGNMQGWLPQQAWEWFAQNRTDPFQGFLPLNRP